MFRTTGARAALRSSRTIQSSLAPSRTTGRRFISTEPPHARSRTWKNSALRWGIAIAGIYYYNTSPVFAEYPQSNLLNPNVDAIDSNREHPTLDQLTASSRNRSQKDASVLQSAIERNSEDLAAQELQKPRAEKTTQSVASESLPTESVTVGAADLEEEAESEGAFNPVTGEINWDCPCLGGMAYGPCGEEFRAAFSCFVYSNEEPKGMNCIDKFQGMQDCFRAHPEVYKGELEDDEALDAELAKEKEELQKEIAERRAEVESQQGSGIAAGKTSPKASSEPAASSSNKAAEKKAKESTQKSPSQSIKSESQPQPEAKASGRTPSAISSDKESERGAPSITLSQRKARAPGVDAVPESEEMIPKAAHDATAPSGE